MGKQKHVTTEAPMRARVIESFKRSMQGVPKLRVGVHLEVEQYTFMISRIDTDGRVTLNLVNIKGCDNPEELEKNRA